MEQCEFFKQAQKSKLMKQFKINFGVVFFILISALVGHAQQGSVYTLSLDEVSRLALVNSFEVQLAQYDADIASTKKGEVESIYDTILDAEVNYEKDKRQRTTTILGTETQENNYNLGISKKLSTGTIVDVDLKNARNATNSSFVTSSVTHESTLGFSVYQDLGKNFLGIQDRGEVKLANLDVTNSQYLSWDRIENHLAAVQKHYWQLVLAKELVTIEEGMVEQAKKLYDLHQEKLADGLVELPEAIASEANYQMRLNELKLANNMYAEVQNQIKLLLDISNEEIQIVPAAVSEIVMHNNDRVAALKSAFENRRDYKIKANEIKRQGVELTMKRNNLWPEINLNASFSRNGLGDHFKQSVTNITDEDNPDFLASLVVSFPLENTKARAQLKGAKLKEAKAIVELKYLERIIAVAISDSVRNVNILREVALSSQNVADLQKKKLEEEMKRFNYGRSSTDTIIRFQEDALAAQRKLIQAKSQYFQAEIDLKKETGSLLNHYWNE